MILVLVLAFLVVGIIFIVLSNLNWRAYKNEDGEFKNNFVKFLYNYDSLTSVIGWVVAIIAAIFLFIMFITIIDEHAVADAKKLQLQETYKALEFKAQSENARDEFGLLNKEIVDEIQEWNEYIVYKKAMQNHFWYGVLYPDIYDEVDVISLE